MHSHRDTCTSSATGGAVGVLHCTSTKLRVFTNDYMRLLPANGLLLGIISRHQQACSTISIGAGFASRC